eukprot:TRINITY_DN440_c0_g1_i2.p1 TRINITY_DN440_c0_g1~~TRINITY_DN440_c0_g1_i2.p1  ORF type:complete len:184 (+),score=58.26 TRINITY_DN440_c0_g1_i2:154-705(+)
MEDVEPPCPELQDASIQSAIVAKSEFEPEDIAANEEHQEEAEANISPVVEPLLEQAAPDAKKPEIETATQEPEVQDNEIGVLVLDDIAPVVDDTSQKEEETVVLSEADIGDMKCPDSEEISEKTPIRIAEEASISELDSPSDADIVDEKDVAEKEDFLPKELYLNPPRKRKQNSCPRIVDPET